MSRELEPWEIIISQVGDGVAEVLSRMAGGEPIAIVLHAWNPTTGVISMTSNLSPENVNEFIQDIAKEHAKGYYSVNSGETRQ